MKKVVLIIALAIMAIGVNAKDLKGTRGFVDLGYGIGIYGSAESNITLLGSYGWQVAEPLFAGVGIGFNYYHDFGDGHLAMPIFGHVRYDLKTSSKYSPFADVKLGYSPKINEIKGLYFSPGFGCRLNLGRLAFNVGLYYVLQKIEVTGMDSGNADNIAIRLGLEF